jgi:hypothetical protein
MMSYRPPKACLHHLTCGSLASDPWPSSPMEAQARLVLPKFVHQLGPAKTNGYTLQGSQVKCIMMSK